jgi:histidine triad (HIT) family protein
LSCIFCRIIEGNIPSIKLYEDNKTFAFMDINPKSDGHTLVIPKQHSVTILEISEEDVAAVAASTRKLALAIQKALSPDGLSLMQSNGSAAGQEVDHFHVHIMPRWQGDRLGNPSVNRDASHIAEVAEKIKAQL